MEFNSEDHTYSKDGAEYTSVTQYISKFKKPFEKYPIASAVGKKKGKHQDEVLKEWDMLKDISIAYGNAVHLSVEYWLNYGEYPKTPFGKKVVEDWLEFDSDTHHSEIVVHDDILKIAGTIDLIKPVDGGWILRDIKTNPHKLDKKGYGKFLPPIDWLEDSKINEYRLQLSIYKHLVEKRGKPVVGLEILPYDDGFDIIEVEPLDVNELLHYD